MTETLSPDHSPYLLHIESHHLGVGSGIKPENPPLNLEEIASCNCLLQCRC